eukprot:CAMPEP_0168333656 /NCGR_PEP_ID=MMETSP0213-20121227/9746_1 /TAXON_ID=151035 /ORGANISM="Euplotes harpa, Strain FSP1.4" /LENGTH=47 /DNA_ID= /DNA_START= /DNA_END= /DNA_ORIENTATION=
MAALPNLVNDLKKVVASSLTEIQAAIRELNNNKLKIVEIGKQCATKK